MDTTIETQPVLPGPHRDDFHDFLHWLGSDRHYSGERVADVVEKPWHYADEYERYQLAGGLER